MHRGETSREGAGARRPVRRRAAGLLAVLCLASALPAAVRAEEVVAIVNAENPSSQMTLHQLRLLYGLYQRTWPGGGRVELLLPEPGSAAMDFLVRVVFRKALELEIDQYYLQAVFQQRIVRRPLQRSEAEAIATVRGDRNAIALVDRDRLGDPSRLRILRVENE